LIEGKYSKIIGLNHESDVEAFGDIVVQEGVFIKGNVLANSGSVFLKNGSIVKGDVFASINVYIDKDASIIGTIKGFSIENHGEIQGDILDANFYRSFGKSSGKIRSKMVLIGEFATHEGPIESICSKIDQNGRHLLKEDA
jgi:cytoskeletal protein CcmA (bactofilin family)